MIVFTVVLLRRKWMVCILMDMAMILATKRLKDCITQL